MTERFIIDDAGTLIDMQTRDTFDYVSDVCGLLNELTEENEQSKMMIATLRNIVLENEDLEKEIKELQKENKVLKDTLSSIVFDSKNVEIMTNSDLDD